MPRYYKYRRTYFPKSYPRKRWATNLVNSTTDIVIPSGSSGAFNTKIICTNSTQSSNPTPVLVKFGRLKIKGDIRYSLTDIANYASAVLYVMFVPQGNELDTALIQNHPEYLLGWTTISMDSGNTFSLSTTLKRNLNSGDSIALYIGVSAVNTVQAQTSFSFFYTCQFWTTSA